MKNIDDFYDKYGLKEFQEGGEQSTVINPFPLKKLKKLSYGIIPGYNKYDLFYERYLDAIKTFMAKGFIKDRIRVLDIGAGEGFFKFFFDALCPELNIEWFGIEIWEARAAFCRHVGYTVCEININETPFPYEDEMFDIVLASHVIEHLAHPDKVMKEMDRVLKKGGGMMIATPTKPPGIAQLDSWYHKIRNRNTGETQQTFTAYGLEKVVLKWLNYPQNCVIQKRGFRILSARKKLPLEDYKWFHDLNMFLAKDLLWFVPEINLIIRKPFGNMASF